MISKLVTRLTIGVLLCQFGTELLSNAAPSQAASVLRVDRVFSDHMVLPCDMAVPVRRTAKPVETIVVSFCVQKMEATAYAQGIWWAKLDPSKVGEPGPPVLMFTTET